MGTAGTIRGVRNLAMAFARAVPMADSGNPAWQTLPIGPAGSLEITIEVNDEGKLVRATPADSFKAPNHLLRVVERTILLLKSGHFAISGTELGAGTMKLSLQATISQVETSVDNDPSATGPYALGFGSPQKNAPGYATFTLRSGRKVYIEISIVGD